jgi:hypothetical protein
MALNINSLTLGEVAKVEELSGLPFAAIADEERPKGLALAALAFVAKRRSDPKFTWNDAQGLTMVDFGSLISMGDDEPAGDGLEGFTGEAAPKAPRKPAPKI